MAIVNYPQTVPKPLISISRTQSPTFQLIQPLRGPGYVKKLSNDAPVSYDLTWRLSRDHAAQLQTWFYSMSSSGLAMGRNQFQLEIDTEFGKLLHTLQLTPDTFSQTQEAHNVFSYQATAIARKVPIPQWWLDHEDLVNSEFFAQRSLFDLVMNKQIPSAYGDNVIAFVDASKKSIKGIDFSRASTATYVDSTGALRTAGVNEQRFAAGGMLLEASATNRCVDSSVQYIGASTNGVWSALGVDATTNNSAGPTLAANACRISVNASGGFKSISYRSGISSVDTITHTVSFYAKPDTTDNISVLLTGNSNGTNGCRFMANLTSGTVSLIGSITGGILAGYSVALNSANGFARISISITVASASNITVFIYPGQYNSQLIGQAVIISDVQFESGDLSTSYIPTNGAPATRSEDVILLNPDITKAKRVYREYTPIGIAMAITETVPYTGELCPHGHLRLLNVLND